MPFPIAADADGALNEKEAIGSRYYLLKRMQLAHTYVGMDGTVLPDFCSHKSDPKYGIEKLQVLRMNWVLISACSNHYFASTYVFLAYQVSIQNRIITDAGAGSTSHA